MDYSASGFRFANPANAAQTQFNNTIGLGGKQNVGNAWSSYFNSGPQAYQDLQSSWGYDPSGNVQSGDAFHGIVDQFSGGGSWNPDLASQGYSPARRTAQDSREGSAATYAAMHGGVPLSQAAGGTTPSMSTPDPLGSTYTGNVSGLPGVGDNTYSQPLTDVSAYLDPSMGFQMKQGMDALQGSAAGRGSLNSGQTLKDALSFSQGLASTDYQNAYQRAMTDTNRRYGVDTGDRDFAYNAATNDRNFNNSREQFLAQMGLNSQQYSAGLSSALAALLSGNASAIGQAQGAGTMGGYGSLANAISQILKYSGGNNAVANSGLGV